MASEPGRLPPGMGAFRPEDYEKGEPVDHMHYWNLALDNALQNIGGAPGKYRKTVQFGAVVDVTNPGGVIEYLVTIDP
jgi:hypothetical protein